MTEDPPEVVPIRFANFSAESQRLDSVLCLLMMSCRSCRTITTAHHDAGSSFADEGNSDFGLHQSLKAVFQNWHSIRPSLEYWLPLILSRHGQAAVPFSARPFAWPHWQHIERCFQCGEFEPVTSTTAHGAVIALFEQLRFTLAYCAITNSQELETQVRPPGRMLCKNWDDDELMRQTIGPFMAHASADTEEVVKFTAALAHEHSMLAAELRRLPPWISGISDPTADERKLQAALDSPACGEIMEAWSQGHRSYKQIEDYVQRMRNGDSAPSHPTIANCLKALGLNSRRS